MAFALPRPFTKVAEGMLHYEHYVCAGTDSALLENYAEPLGLDNLCYYVPRFPLKFKLLT